MRSYFLFQLGRTQEAIDAGREAIARNQEDLIAYLVLGSALQKAMWSGPRTERTRKLGEFLRLSNKAVELNPDNRAAQVLLTLAEAESKDYIRRQVMSTLRKKRALSWMVALVFGFQGMSQAQQGFFDGVTRLSDGVNTPSNEWGPSISSDGLTLYFGSQRPGGPGDFDMYVGTRDAVDQPFGNVRILERVNTGVQEAHPSISSDGLTLYFSRSGGTWKASRDAGDDPSEFSDPVLLEPPLNFARSPDISADGLTIYFTSDRPDGIAEGDWQVSSVLFQLWLTYIRLSSEDAKPHSNSFG